MLKLLKKAMFEQGVVQDVHIKKIIPSESRLNFSTGYYINQFFHKEFQNLKNYYLIKLQLNNGQLKFFALEEPIGVVLKNQNIRVYYMSKSNTLESFRAIKALFVIDSDNNLLAASNWMFRVNNEKQKTIKGIINGVCQTEKYKLEKRGNFFDNIYSVTKGFNISVLVNASTILHIENFVFRLYHETDLINFEISAEVAPFELTKKARKFIPDNVKINFFEVVNFSLNDGSAKFTSGFSEPNLKNINIIKTIPIVFNSSHLSSKWLKLIIGNDFKFLLFLFFRKQINIIGNFTHQSLPMFRGFDLKKLSKKLEKLQKLYNTDFLDVNLYDILKNISKSFSRLDTFFFKREERGIIGEKKLFNMSKVFEYPDILAYMVALEGKGEYLIYIPPFNLTDFSYDIPTQGRKFQITQQVDINGIKANITINPLKNAQIIYKEIRVDNILDFIPFNENMAPSLRAFFLYLNNPEMLGIRYAYYIQQKSNSLKKGLINFLLPKGKTLYPVLARKENIFTYLLWFFPIPTGRKIYLFHNVLGNFIKRNESAFPFMGPYSILFANEINGQNKNEVFIINKYKMNIEPQIGDIMQVNCKKLGDYTYLII